MEGFALLGMVIGIVVIAGFGQLLSLPSSSKSSDFFCEGCGSKGTFSHEHTLHGFSTNTTISGSCSACDFSYYNEHINGERRYDSVTGDEIWFYKQVQ